MIHFIYKWLKSPVSYQKPAVRGIISRSSAAGNDDAPAFRRCDAAGSLLLLDETVQLVVAENFDLLALAHAHEAGREVDGGLFAGEDSPRERETKRIDAKRPTIIMCFERVLVLAAHGN